MSTRLGTFLFWAYLLFIVWGSATAYNPADPDLWHRLALGDALWKTGHFPPADAFSYLAEADARHAADHEWGSALIFYGSYRWGGEAAIVGIKIVTLAITITLLVLAGTMNRRPSVLTAAFYALVILALLPSFQSTVRCMTFTHIFFALWLYWFQRERHGRPVPTWCYVLSMIPWANLHGGFAIGLAWLLAVAFLELVQRGAWKTWVIRFVLCSLATLINPFGFQLWRSTARALVATRQGFPEWAPVSWWPNPLAYPGYKLLLVAVIAALVIKIYRRGWRKIDPTVVVLIALAGLLSLTSARHTSLFAVVSGAFIPSLFRFDLRMGAIRNPIHRLGYMAFCSALLVIPLLSTCMVMPGDGLGLRYPDVSCPVQAVDYLKEQEIHGKLLVPFNYGSYALWELRGRMRVSMDGRYDLVYLPATYRRVDDFFFARGNWRTLLTTPPPDAILLPVADAVYPKLLESPDWGEVWHNETDAIFLPK